MKSAWGLLVVVIFAISLNSCFDAPTYPTTPEIEYKSLKFVDVSDPSSFDSLILTVKFKDGDGDLGLATDEVGCYTVNGKKICYNDKFYYQFPDGTLITYKTKRTKPGYDTLPAFVKPYNCINWEVQRDNNNVVKDTVYFTLNPDHYNIFIDFLVKQSDGTFKEFDWRTEFNYPNCGIPFDGRFPVLSKDLSKKSPLEGEIRYGMTSVGFLVLFSTKTLKLLVNIQDRALNKSNVIETPEFRL